MADIHLERLRKEYDRGQVVAVEDLDLSIEDGEFVTVVGPSGCGKTTTLRMLAGLERPTKGSVTIGGEDVTDIPTEKRPIAMVFQNYALYPHKTVMENMEFGLRMRTDLSKSERHERVREMAEMMDIGELLDDTPDELSGGQKQRVALGRAIVREPELFLFDEPLSNLDAKLRTEMRAEIQQLQQEFGVTAIYVTHDQEEAMTMGDRLAILNDGKLQQFGAPTDVYENPANEFVAGFIGSPSMNFLPVEVVDDEGLSVRGRQAELNVEFSEPTGEHAFAEGTYTLGIRPEDITVVPVDDGPTATAEVQVVEPIGSDNYLHLDLAPDFIARVNSSVEPAVGDRIGISFDETDIHLFHPETGQAVELTGRELEPSVA